jgi:hypothetical protein
MASDVEANAAAEAPEGKNWKRKGKHDKEKPWDEDPTIDRWTVEKFDPSWNKGGLLEVNSFSTLFPEYRGNHIPFPSRLPQCDYSLEIRCTFKSTECLFGVQRSICRTRGRSSRARSRSSGSRASSIWYRDG